MTVPRTSPEFIDWLAARHAAIATLRDDHVEFYEELIPHVLFGDVTRHAAELARRGRSGDAPAAKELDALLHDLDTAILEGFGTDDPVENVVWVSFVENATGVPGDDAEPLRDELRQFHYLGYALARYE